MTAGTRFGGRFGWLAVAVTSVLLLAGGGLVVKAMATPGAPPQPEVVQVAPIGSDATSGSSGAANPPVSAGIPPASPGGAEPVLPPSPPVALMIPSIGVHTEGIVDLKLDQAGKLQAPTDFDRAGWYVGGPTPGELGPAVIGAHVDSKAGPAVFYRLGSLAQGAEVSVIRQDGSTVTFVVDRVERYSKAAFPTATVYGDTKGRAELRLITCGGAFDHATGHYVDNIVAFAHVAE